MKLLVLGAFVLLAKLVHCIDEEDVIIKPGKAPFCQQIKLSLHLILGHTRLRYF